MKYCVVNPDITFRYYNTVDEVLFSFNQFHKQYLERIPIDKTLIFSAHPTERILTKDELKFLADTKEVYQNMYVSIPYDKREKLIDQLEDIGVAWFFNTYCTSKDMLCAQLLYEPTQIYIAEELGFELKDIHHSTDIPIRIVANVAQSSYGTNREVDQITKFFVRPEDTIFYENIVDTFELWSASPKKLSVIFKIYKDRVWKGELNEIIQDLHIFGKLSNRTIQPLFGENRLNCHKRCVYNQCHLCSRAISFAEDLTEAGLEVQKEKNITRDFEMDIEPFKKKVKEEIDYEFEVDEESMSNVEG